MSVSSGDIMVLTEEFSFMLSRMREYNQLTVELLNCEIDDARPLLEERQKRIEEISTSDSRVQQVLRQASGAQTGDSFGTALRLLVRDQREPILDDAIQLAKQLLGLFQDTAVLEKRLLSDVQKQREAMLQDLKSVTDQQRKVTGTAYFTQGNSMIGSSYDRKK